MPETAPDGLKLLLKQCWSTKPRNRPSFVYVVNHLEILKAELEELGPEEWKARSNQWRIEAQHIEYPETLTRGNSHLYGDIVDGNWIVYI